jgi:cytochrome c oxidase subunit II
MQHVRFHKLLSTTALPLALLFSSNYAVAAPSRSKAPQRVVEITAKRFGFTPDRITLKKGEAVILRLHSEDVTHGFFSRPLKIDEDIPAGQTKDIKLKPDTVGSFSTICDHFCGVSHGNMKMTIVVE